MKVLKPYKIELADTLQHHWYHVHEGSKYLGVVPSVTTVLNAYPQSPHLVKWIAEQGWSEAQKIKSEAGVRGTNVHAGIEAMLNNRVLNKIDYSLEEWWKLSTFVNWHESYKPEIIATEMPVFSKKLKVAGRLDCVAKINNEIYLIDWKTSSSIYNHFPLQFAVYAQALEEMTDIKVDNTAVLQMGAKNRDGYRFVLYPNWKREHLPVFKSVYDTWNYENKRAGAKKVEAPVLKLPEELKLNN